MKQLGTSLVFLMGLCLSQSVYCEQPQYQSYQPVQSPSLVSNVPYNPQPQLSQVTVPVQTPEIQISTPALNAFNITDAQTPIIS